MTKATQPFPAAASPAARRTRPPSISIQTVVTPGVAGASSSQSTTKASVAVWVNEGGAGGEVKR